MISVVIPVYKQTDLFLENLKNNVFFLNNCQIIVVNDDPTTDLQFILKAFPYIQLIQNAYNLGFSGAVNVGLQKVKGTYVFLLNSDVRLQDDSFKKALTHFSDTSVFAVSFAQKEKNGSIVGKNAWYWKNGFFHHIAHPNHLLGITAWAEGGACIIDAKKLNKLNGFDEQYNPFYWEDVDLSYRAWKSGYKVLFDPAIVVEHNHETTIHTYFASSMKKIAFRNQLLFVWANISDQTYRKNHFRALFKYILFAVFSREWHSVLGFIEALRIYKKSKNTKTYVKTDKEIITLFEHDLS